MSVRQFANSLSIITRAEESDRGRAFIRHIAWQGRKLLFPRPVRLRFSQSVITDTESGGVISMVNMLGCYDYNNMHLTKLLLAEAPRGVSPVFVDVGANIGAYTLLASEIATATVVSLEPVPAAFEKLRENIRLNGRTRVTTMQVAAGNAPGQLRMTCNGASTINHVVEPGQDGDNIVVVPADTLDAICTRLSLRPTVIKIDVEGHEPAVLEGAQECFETCQACFVENGNRPEVVALMQRYGMTGPYYYQHRRRCLQLTPQRLPEDQIFINADFYRSYPMIAVESA